MKTSKRILLTVNLASALLSYAGFGYAENMQLATKLIGASSNKSSFYLWLLYLRPSSNNLKYATFVTGVQPYYQSWHYQEIIPDYHPTFELGINYAIPRTNYSVSMDWTHLNSTDKSYKQASTNTDLTTVEFVAPPFEMSPPVFGIKRADSKVNFDFDNVLLNSSRLVEFDNQQVQARFFGGLDLLGLNQTVTTTFSNYAGSPPTPYSYPLPPDPSFSFQLQNVSKYFGLGPDIGMSLRYKTKSGFGLMGEFVGLLTAGTEQAVDNFTSTSARLTALGIGTSHQQITSPNTTQIVIAADAKLGVFYNYQGPRFPDVTIEAGYRIASYANAISTINPSTLVQPGVVIATPEFATGTMAIVSTDARTRPFSFNGPFLNLKIAIA